MREQRSVAVLTSRTSRSHFTRAITSDGVRHTASPQLRGFRVGLTGQRGTSHPLIEGVAGEGVSEQLSSIISSAYFINPLIELLASLHTTLPLRVFLSADPFLLELRRRLQTVRPRDVQNGPTYIVYHDSKGPRYKNPSDNVE